MNYKVGDLVCLPEKNHYEETYGVIYEVFDYEPKYKIYWFDGLDTCEYESDIYKYAGRCKENKP